MFTITPDSGFSISQVLVDGVDQGAVSTYTFTNVVTAHTISATFVLGGGGGTQTTTLDMGDSEWFDARLGASGPWGTFSIYANDVLIGTKTADGTSTWNCPQTDVPSGARIDIVADVGFTDPLEVYDYYTPHTFTSDLPAGVTRLEAATWSGFPLLTSGDGADGYNWGYPENDYTYVYLAPATITGIVYSTGGPVTNYTLTYTAGANGTITGTSPQTVASGGSGTAVTAVANTGYHFVNWSDGITTATRTDTNVTANKSVTANFAVDTYTLTYTAGANGTITGTSPQTVASGGSGTAVTAVANTGYHFVNWSDGITTATRTDTNVTANKSVTANFAVDTYTLTYTAGANGTISGHEPADGEPQRLGYRGHRGRQHGLPLRELVRRHHDGDTYRHQRDGQQERDRQLRGQRQLHDHVLGGRRWLYLAGGRCECLRRLEPGVHDHAGQRL